MKIMPYKTTQDSLYNTCYNCSSYVYIKFNI